MRLVIYSFLLVGMVSGCASVGDRPTCTTTADYTPPNYRDHDPGFMLDKNIEARILAPGHVTKIMGIHGMSYSEARFLYKPTEKQTGYDVLGLSLSLAGDFGFEGAWHGYLIARKKHADRDWIRCEVFYVVDDMPAAHLAGMTDVEMEKHLTPYWGEQSSGGDSSTRANAGLEPPQK